MATGHININKIRKIKLESKSITSNGTYIPADGFDGFSDVQVNVPTVEGDVKLESRTVTENGKITPSEGYTGFSDVTVAVPNKVPNLQEKQVKPLTEQQEITADDTFDGLSKVTIEPIKLQDKEVTENGEVLPDEGYDGLSKVTVNIESAAVIPQEFTQIKRGDTISSSIFSFDMAGFDSSRLGEPQFAISGHSTVLEDGSPDNFVDVKIWEFNTPLYSYSYRGPGYIYSNGFRLSKTISLVLIIETGVESYNDGFFVSPYSIADFNEFLSSLDESSYDRSDPGIVSAVLSFSDGIYNFLTFVEEGTCNSALFSLLESNGVTIDGNTKVYTISQNTTLRFNKELEFPPFINKNKYLNKTNNKITSLDNVDFTCFENSFNKISFTIDDSGIIDLSFGITDLSFFKEGSDSSYYSGDGWTDDKYRTITLNTPMYFIDKDLYDLIIYNSSVQEYSRPFIALAEADMAAFMSAENVGKLIKYEGIATEQYEQNRLYRIDSIESDGIISTSSSSGDVTASITKSATNTSISSGTNQMKFTFDDGTSMAFEGSYLSLLPNGMGGEDTTNTYHISSGDQYISIYGSGFSWNGYLNNYTYYLNEGAQFSITNQSSSPSLTKIEFIDKLQLTTYVCSPLYEKSEIG